MLYVLHQVIDTEVNRIVMQGFILIWLGISLCLVLSMDMSLSKPQELVMGRPGVLQSMGWQRVKHD